MQVGDAFAVGEQSGSRAVRCSPTLPCMF